MSDNNRQFPPALETYLELKADEPALHPALMPVPPNLDRILAEIGPLPREALFLGVAVDGLPVLLNLHDSLPGPLLVVGEEGAGKTEFLRSLAHSLTRTHRPDELQFGVVTDHPDEWNELEDAKHRVGIFSASHESSIDFLHSLASWTHSNRDSKQTVLLLIDELESIAKLDIDTLQKFSWLLARGPSRRVWPIVTLNAERYGQVLSWIPIFRTRIFGRVRNDRVAGALGGDRFSALDKLEAPVQFSLRENQKWVKFRLPDF